MIEVNREGEKAETSNKGESMPQDSSRNLSNKIMRSQGGVRYVRVNFIRLNY